MFKCTPVTHFLGLQPDLRLVSSPRAGSCGMEGMDVEERKKGPRDDRVMGAWKGSVGG